jgi:diacylglycerol kinase family enzyme
MQAHLIYNSNAGNGDRSAVEELQAALEQVGFYPVYRATENEDDLDSILTDVEGLVVAAGGDGTVRAVVTRLVGKGVPVAILPMGTANNIAKTLDIPLDPLQTIAGLGNHRPFPFDVGYVEAPWGTDYFVEGTGFGFFADVLAMYDPEKGKSVWRGIGALGDILLKGHAYKNSLHLNGERVPGEFLLVEVLNTSAVGPRLKFAADASPGDGVLDLVCIHASDREGFLTYLTSLIREDLERLETVARYQIESLRFSWQGFALHVDGEVRPPDWDERRKVKETEWGPRHYLAQADTGEINIKVIPAAVTLWLPALADKDDE